MLIMSEKKDEEGMGVVYVQYLRGIRFGHPSLVQGNQVLVDDIILIFLAHVCDTTGTHPRNKQGELLRAKKSNQGLLY